MLQITLSLTFIFFSQEKRIHLLEKVKPFIAGKIRSSQLIISMFKDGAKEYSRILGSVFSTKYIGYLTLLIMLTIIVIIAPAIILYGILVEYGYGNFLNALYAFRSGEVLGVLPVTIGGAGLTEAGVYLYMERVLGIDSWSSVIKWRIATYYITLIVTSSMLVPMSIKYFKRSLTS